MKEGKLTYPLLWFFLFLCVVYHSNLRPVASGDSLPASLVPFSILLDGTVTLDRFGPYISQHVWYSSSVIHESGGHWYSIYPIGGSVVASPLYVPLALAPAIRRLPPVSLIAVARVAEKVAAVTIAALTAAVVLLLLRQLTSPRAAWILGFVFALGTGNWSTASQALWQHTFGQLAIAGCLYAVTRWSKPEAAAHWDWIAGACAAWALTIRPTNVALLPALALALWLRPAGWMQALRVFAIPAVAGALVASYNLAGFQHVRGGYREGLSGNFISGFLGSLLSPGRGLLLYTPIVLFALAALAPRARASLARHRLVALAAATFAVLHIAIVSFWPVWWGGYCWGPRLLTEILVPAMVLIAVGLPAIRGNGWKQAFAVVAVYCCCIQAIGVYCYPKGRWDAQPVTVNDDPRRLWNWADNPIGRTVKGGIAWEPYAIVGAGLRGGLPAAAKELQRLGINSY